MRGGASPIGPVILPQRGEGPAVAVLRQDESPRNQFIRGSAHRARRVSATIWRKKISRRRPCGAPAAAIWTVLVRVLLLSPHPRPQAPCLAGRRVAFLYPSSSSLRGRRLLFPRGTPFRGAFFVRLPVPRQYGFSPPGRSTRHTSARSQAACRQAARSSSRRQPEIRRGNVANGMPAVLVQHQLLRASQRLRSALPA